MFELAHTHSDTVAAEHCLMASLVSYHIDVLTSWGGERDCKVGVSL